MRWIANLMLVAAMTQASGGYAAVNCEPVSDGLLQYDDGTPHWVNWFGAYRGVWFHTSDFYTWPCSIDVGMAEIWFYHHYLYQWDTSTAQIELWAGDPGSGLSLLLDSCSGTAIHYAPIFLEFSPAVTVPPDFWCIQRTSEFSTGGWPSPLADMGSVSGPVHSFYADNQAFIAYQQGANYCNYFFRIESDTALSRISWGALRSLF